MVQSSAWKAVTPTTGSATGSRTARPTWATWRFICERGSFMWASGRERAIKVCGLFASTVMRGRYVTGRCFAHSGLSDAASRPFVPAEFGNNADGIVCDAPAGHARESLTSTRSPPRACGWRKPPMPKSAVVCKRGSICSRLFQCRSKMTIIIRRSAPGCTCASYILSGMEA